MKEAVWILIALAILIPLNFDERSEAHDICKRTYGPTAERQSDSALGINCIYHNGQRWISAWIRE